MQQTVPIEYTGTSYSALLHGPDTPPFHPEPSWGFSAGPFGIQILLAEQKRTEQKPPKEHFSFEGAPAREQNSYYPKVGLRIQHPNCYPRENDCSRHPANSGEGFHSPSSSPELVAKKNLHHHKFEQDRPSLPSDGQNFMQSFRCAMSFSSDKKEMDYAHPQEAVPEKSCLEHEDSKTLPLRPMPMPTTQMPGSFYPNQSSAWNVMHCQSMSNAGGSQMQHASGSSYNSWDNSSMQHTPYSVHDSVCVQTGATYNAPYNWQTSSRGVMTDTYSHYYPERYYACGNNFSSFGETDNVTPVSFVNYSSHYQEPQVNLHPANPFFPGLRAPANGSNLFSTSNRASAPDAHVSQKNREGLVMVGGQGLQQCQGLIERRHVGQSVNALKKCREEAETHNVNRDKENAFTEKDGELKVPQTKKRRECAEADAYQIKSGQLSGKFSPQAGAISSMNVNERVESTPRHSQNLSDVQCGAFYPSGEDHCSQVLSQGCYHGIGSEQEGRSSESITKMSHGSGMPSSGWARVLSPNFTWGHMLYREHTGSSSSLFSSVSGQGLPQGDPMPGMRLPSGARQMEGREANNCFFSEGYHDGYKEGCAFTRIDVDAKRVQESLSDHPMVQLGARAQAGSYPAAHSPLNASTFQQVPSPVLAAKSAVSGNRLSSGGSTLEWMDSGCTMANPCNAGEGAGGMNTSSLTYHGTCQYAYGIPGPSYPSAVNKHEQFISSFQSESEQRRTSHSLTSPYPSHLEPSFQMPELKSFEHFKAGPLQTGSQQVEFGRPGLEKFYPPHPFHSHSSHFQGESGRVENLLTQNDTFQGAQCLKNFEARIESGGAKDVTLKPVNYQASAGDVVEGALLCSASGESDLMRCGSTLSEPTEVHRQHAFFLEAGNVSRQQPDSTFYVEAAHRGSCKSITNETHSISMTIGSQGSGGHIPMPSDNVTPKLLRRPSGYPEPLACRKSLRLANKDEHPFLQHCNDINTPASSCPILLDSEAAVSEKASSEQVPQRALHLNRHGALIIEPRKRKKLVPCLVPWHVLACQTKCQLHSLSKAELIWATATNRLVDKDGGVESSDMGGFKAVGRLKVTTQLMQQIFYPLPSMLMQRRQLVSLECGIYSLSKSTLGDACRLLASTEREQKSDQNIADLKITASHRITRTWNMVKEEAMIKLVERVVEKVKQLEFELARLDCSMSMLKVRGKSQDIERLSIACRLGRSYGADFVMSLSESRVPDIIINNSISNRKTPPQRYVIAVPMPRMLPEGARCLSL